MALGAHPRATPPFEEVSRLPYSGDLRSLFWLVPRHGWNPTAAGPPWQPPL